MIPYLGLIWLGILFLSSWALLGVLQKQMAWKTKLIWAAAVLFLPVLGALAWIFVGRERV